jgi:hypothetical protein
MKMLRFFRLIAIAAVFSAAPASAYSQDMIAPAPTKGGSTVIYRQVMPDGRIVYSDKAQKGGKVDRTIQLEPAIKGNLWTTESGSRPAVVPQIERTPVRKVPSSTASGNSKTSDEANSDVIRAEMFLEDARKRQEAGIEPLPGERTGIRSGGSRLNEAYEARQKLLAREVIYAEALLKKAIEDRDKSR